MSVYFRGFILIFLQTFIDSTLKSYSIWNTVYLSQAIEHLKATGKYQEELLPHISPLGWEHIN